MYASGVPRELARHVVQQLGERPLRVALPAAISRAAIACAVLNGSAVVAHQRIGQLGQRRPAVAGAGLERRGVELGACAIAAATSFTARVASRNIDERRAAADRPRCRRCRRTACCGRSITIACACPSALLAMRARVLERHRVALLRHDAAALHEAVAEPQVVELRGAPQQQVLHEAAEADQQHRRRRCALQQVVDRRDAAVGVAGRPAEAEQIARSAADRSGKPVPVIAHAPSGLRLVRSYAAFSRDRVALELLDHRQQIVRDGGRLRRAACACARRRTVSRWRVRRGRAASARSSKRRRRQAEDELALPHPVHRHVDVVAAAGRCAAGRPRPRRTRSTISRST